MRICETSQEGEKSCKKGFAIVTCVFFGAISLTIILWIVITENTDEEDERLMKVRGGISCRAKGGCRNGQHGQETKNGQAEVTLQPSCLNDKTVYNQLLNVTETEFLSGWKESFQYGTGARERKFLKSSMKTFYRPTRATMHWIVLPTSDKKSSQKFWVTVGNFERYKSTYTVSPGPDESYEKGVMVIPDSGLYNVYAKLTFACTIVHAASLRLTMELVLHEHVRPYPTTLLRDIEDVSCSIVGDVATLFLEGSFKLVKGSAVVLRYKSPDHIVLSRDQNQAYKSYMGAYQLSGA